MEGAATVLRAELPRKAVHLLTALIPPASMLLGKTPVVLGLAVVALAYAVSEYLRSHRARKTLFSDAYSHLFRDYEKAEGRMVVRPVYLAVGVSTCLLLFPEDVAYAAIMLVSFGDGLARVERLLLGYNVKDGERAGSGVASFTLGFLAAGLFVDPIVAFLATAVAYTLEVYPTIVDDNITVPIGAAATMLVLQATGSASILTSIISGVDASLYWWLAKNRLPTLYDSFLFLEYATPFAFAALTAAYTLKTGIRSGARLAAAALAMVVIGLVAKELAGRPRPCVYFHGEGVPSCPLTDYSFPGLHATIGGTYLVYPARLPRRTQLAWRATTTTLALTVGLIGPYTGIHWLSDIAGGFLLSATLIPSIVLPRPRDHHEPP